MNITAEDKKLLKRIWEFEKQEGAICYYQNDLGKYTAWRAAITLASFERYIVNPPLFSNAEVI